MSLQIFNSAMQVCLAGFVRNIPGTPEHFQEAAIGWEAGRVQRLLVALNAYPAIAAARMPTLPPAAAAAAEPPAQSAMRTRLVTFIIALAISLSWTDVCRLFWGTATFLLLVTPRRTVSSSGEAPHEERPAALDLAVPPSPQPPQTPARAFWVAPLVAAPLPVTPPAPHQPYLDAVAVDAPPALEGILVASGCAPEPRPAGSDTLPHMLVLRQIAHHRATLDSDDAIVAPLDEEDERFFAALPSTPTPLMRRSTSAGSRRALIDVAANSSSLQTVPRLADGEKVDSSNKENLPVVVDVGVGKGKEFDERAGGADEDSAVGGEAGKGKECGEMVDGVDEADVEEGQD
ncbi:hypothetical protein C8R46DRAFT_292436 [Mycena filopes]|nr:hypothetical protein C8R46DRAFT_292436 [Mycena filopes]